MIVPGLARSACALSRSLRPDSADTNSSSPGASATGAFFCELAGGELGQMRQLRPQIGLFAARQGRTLALGLLSFVASRSGSLTVQARRAQKTRLDR